MHLLRLIALSSLMIVAAGCQTTTHYVGTWQQGPDPDHGGIFHCSVKRISATRYEAHFHGTCGRNYEYRLKLDGRKSDEHIIFCGVQDLGPHDGGEYTWRGTLSGDEFTGEYQNLEGGKGTFELKSKEPRNAGS